MDVERHLLALRHEAEALADAAQDCLQDPVPSCPDWDVAALLDHVGHAYRWAATIVRTHADAEVTDAEVPAAANADPVAAFHESLAELVETLSNEAPDAPAWNWSEQDMTVAFWARRMANETAVHRWDAQLARGDAQPVEDDIAVDGIDELLSVFLAHHLDRHPQEGLRGTFRVEATDTGDVWHGTLLPDRAEVTRADRRADATLKGTASNVLLALWGRAVEVEASGDERITALLLE